MKNGSISKQFELQKQNFIDEKGKKIFQSSEKENLISYNLDSKADENHSYNQQNNDSGDSLLSIFSLRDGNGYDNALVKELQKQKRKNKGIKRWLSMTN